MRGLDQSRYTIDQIFERQKPDESVIKYLSIFHERLATQIELKQKYFEARTNIIGFSYFCNDKKAFLFLTVCQHFLSLRLFTGNKSISGIIKGIWLNKGDNIGCKPFRIIDDATLNKGIHYAIEAYMIAEVYDHSDKILATTHNGNKINTGEMTMDKFKAKTIIQNAVEFTKPRWSQYSESWKNIEIIFILRGYEQLGFELFKMEPVLKDLGILSIDSLGGILLKYPNKRSYTRKFAGSLTSEFYLALQKGSSGIEGNLFAEAVQTFLDKKIGNPGMAFWKLLYQMLQACSYLKQNYSSSFAKYMISKYASFTSNPDISEFDFLNMTVPEWELFLLKTKPWRELMGIGPNVFDFIFGDIIEAHFVKNSYKFDSSNQHFLTVTGIAQLIVPFDRETTVTFLKNLYFAASLREINKGIYTYCSKTEAPKYGYCRRLSKCQYCNVFYICDKIL